MSKSTAPANAVKNCLRNKRQSIDVFVVMAACSLTTQEPSRAGTVAPHKLNHLGELKRASGDDSGQLVGQQLHI